MKINPYRERIILFQYFNKCFSWFESRSMYDKFQIFLEMWKYGELLSEDFSRKIDQDDLYESFISNHKVVFRYKKKAPERPFKGFICGVSSSTLPVNEKLSKSWIDVRISNDRDSSIRQSIYRTISTHSVHVDCLYKKQNNIPIKGISKVYDIKLDIMVDEWRDKC